MFYSMTWQDDSFDNSVSVLAFNLKAARAAYPAQSAIRVEPINAKRKNELLAEGRLIHLALWDASNPTEFKISL